MSNSIPVGQDFDLPHTPYCQKQLFKPLHQKKPEKRLHKNMIHKTIAQACQI